MPEGIEIEFPEWDKIATRYSLGEHPDYGVLASGHRTTSIEVTIELVYPFSPNRHWMVKVTPHKIIAPFETKELAYAAWLEFKANPC